MNSPVSSARRDGRQDDVVSRMRPLAIVTGASSGIGLELARCCAQDGYDLVIAADEPQIQQRADELRAYGADVIAVQADLATPDGVQSVVSATRGRPVDALLANAGRGLGRAFLEQNFEEVRRVVDTNVMGTLALVQKVGREMRTLGRGRILITGSIAGFMPGSYQAVYNGTEACLDSFAFALREELQDAGITVTCLMPGATDTDFFARAGMLDTKVGAGPKDDPAVVARLGFQAMQRGKPGIITGARNRMEVAMTRVLPGTRLARMHAAQAAPGTAYRRHRPYGRKNVTVAAVAALGGVALLALTAWALSSSGATHALRHRWLAR